MQKPESETATVPIGEVPAHPVILLAPGTRIGERYEVRGVLGKGGSAVVYLAFDRELDLEVALKVLRADRMSETSLKRFRREAAIARDATSPRLVRTFDIGTSAGTVYLTMEVVEGTTLRDRLRSGPLPVDKAIHVADEIVEGLQVLHSLGIVHRDVKPGNVLLTHDGAIKLADFGLARRWDSDETRATVGEGVVGTPEYLAPEQVLGQEVSARTDLYSLGVVLFEMLTGTVPHQRRSVLGTLLAHLESRPPDVRRLRPDVPRWLAQLVTRLLQRKPADRYPSAAATLADLRSRRLSIPSALRRYARLAAAAALAALGSLVFAFWPTGTAARYSHLVALGESGIAAIATDGRKLWTRPDVDRHVQIVTTTSHLEPGGPRLLVTIFWRKFEYVPQDVGTLLFVAPETGEVVRRARMPGGANLFPTFSNRFRPRWIVAEDLDRDGIDEILVYYHHIPEWPSYCVLFEPRSERSRIVFVASGHHPLLGIHDLDGDDRAELIFVGINNLLGWVNAAAAIRITPWIGEELDQLPSPAYSPDDVRNAAEPGSLLWYALLPRGHFPGDPPLMEAIPVLGAMRPTSPLKSTT